MVNVYHQISTLTNFHVWPPLCSKWPSIQDTKFFHSKSCSWRLSYTTRTCFKQSQPLFEVYPAVERSRWSDGFVRYMNCFTRSMQRTLSPKKVHQNTHIVKWKLHAKKILLSSVDESELMSKIRMSLSPREPPPPTVIDRTQNLSFLGDHLWENRL